MARKYQVNLADRKRALVIEADYLNFEGNWAILYVWDPIDKRDVVKAAFCSPIMVGELRQ